MVALIALRHLLSIAASHLRYLCNCNSVGAASPGIHVTCTAGSSTDISLSTLDAAMYAATPAEGFAKK